MRITKKDKEFFDATVLIDGAEICDFEWADTESGEILLVASETDARGLAGGRSRLRDTGDLGPSTTRQGVLAGSGHSRFQIRPLPRKLLIGKVY
jgi:hypothetical protein